MLSHLRKGLTPFQRLSLNITKQFTIKNYMKTFQLQNVQRTNSHLKHDLFRVDQFKQFSHTKSSVEDFINQQNKHYESTRKLWAQRTQNYYESTSSRRDTRTSSAQQQYDNYSYFTEVKFLEDKEYTIIHRRNNLTKKSEIVLDIMQYYSLKKHYKTVELMRTAFSDSHRYLAFGYDLNNNEHIRWMIKDTKQNRIVGIKGWENNVLESANQIVFYKDKGVFYTKTQNRRPCKLFYQEFDSEPQLLLEQKDPSYWLFIELCKDKSQLIISASNKSHTKAKCLSISSETQLKLTSKTVNSLTTQIHSSSQIEKVHVNHCSDYFIIWRQQEAQNTISIKMDKEKKQRIIHTLNNEESLTDMDIFQKFIVLYIQKNTKPILRIISMENQSFTVSEPQLPYPVGKISPGMNQIYSTNSLMFYISTPFIYNEGYEYNILTNSFKVVQKFQLTGPKFNYKKYEIKSVNVPAIDGEMIPLTILCEKLSNQYPKKLMIKVYGYYGLPNQVSYDNTNYSLLQNGWTIAYAHVRGGSDKGKQWHIQALQSKSLTWSDIQDCTGYLIRQKYTHPSILFLSSHSAGAIAVWNAINKSPHLFKAVILNYPFLDVLNTLLDPNDSLSASDYAEFGNPLVDKKAFRKIQSLSPYENIQQKSYPLVYIVGGQNDYRCPVGQLAKFVKRFRAKVETSNRISDKISQKGIILKVYDKASHLGSSDIGQQNFNNCQVYGFLDYLIYEASYDCKY